ADHEVAQAILTPRFHLEGPSFAHSRVCTWTLDIPILKNEHRNLVLADLEDQVRSRGLSKIGHTSADEGKFGTLQLREIESKRKLSLEPRLHSMAVRRNHLDGICAGQR